MWMQLSNGERMRESSWGVSWAPLPRRLSSGLALKLEARGREKSQKKTQLKAAR